MRGVGVRSSGDEYERHRLAVLGMLAKRFPRLDEDERLAIYHDAWTRVLGKRQRGEKINSLRAYLLATCGAEALNLLSRGRVPMPVGPDDPRVSELSDEAPSLDEQVVTRDQARIARDLIDTLDARQRDVLKLRWDLQLSGAEIRAALGLTERQYRRLAEEGAAAIAERVEELESGEWSRRTRSLLVACLVEVTQDGERRVGIASRRQREEAQRLLESDPHVAALYNEVRRTVRGAAALLPLPVLVADISTGPVARLAQLGADIRESVTDAFTSVKHHATSLYVRVADPALATGTPRPGAAVVAVTGVLALGGAAYGTHEIASRPESAPRVSPSQRLVSTPAPPPPPEAPTPKPKAHADKKPAEPTRTETQPPQLSPATPASPSVPASIPAPPAPTPQPSQPAEFGFED